jgi:hypothetical protein
LLPPVLEQDLKCQILSPIHPASRSLRLNAVLPKVSEPHDAGPHYARPEGFRLTQFRMRQVDHVITVRVATDPMNSDVTGWLNGELGCEK